MWTRLFLAVCALSLATPVKAGTITISGSGVLAVAEGRYAAGDPFSFSVTLTEVNASYDATSARFPGVGPFNFTIRGDSFSEAWLYYGFYYGPTSSFGAGASTASSFTQAGFQVFLGRTDPHDLSFPFVDEVNGKPGTFSYRIGGVGTGDGAFVAQAVPEVSAWLTLVLGVGGAGILARRRGGFIAGTIDSNRDVSPEVRV